MGTQWGLANRKVGQIRGLPRVGFSDAEIATQPMLMYRDGSGGRVISRSAPESGAVLYFGGIPRFAGPGFSALRVWEGIRGLGPC